MFILSFRLRAGKVLLCTLAVVLAVTVGVVGVRAVFGGGHGLRLRHGQAGSEGHGQNQ